MSETGQIRQFETGATRDTDAGKLRYDGFLSPHVLERYAQYMHQHRQQADGALRDPDNWQKGIPHEAYLDSLVRHTMDAWRQYRSGRVVENDLLCAIMFNAMGLLYEQLGGPGRPGGDFSIPVDFSSFRVSYGRAATGGDPPPCPTT